MSNDPNNPHNPQEPPHPPTSLTVENICARQQHSVMILLTGVGIHPDLCSSPSPGLEVDGGRSPSGHSAQRRGLFEVPVPMRCCHVVKFGGRFYMKRCWYSLTGLNSPGKAAASVQRNRPSGLHLLLFTSTGPMHTCLGRDCGRESGSETPSTVMKSNSGALMVTESQF